MMTALGKPLPFKRPSHAIKLILFLSLSIAIMVMDYHGTRLQQIRAGLSALVYPIRQIASVPARIGDWFNEIAEDDGQLRIAYRNLQRDYSKALAKQQKFEALETENTRLRRLLKSAARVADRAIVAELLQAHPEPSTRKIIINKGSKDGVFIGQPVIDNYGIMGQVTETGIFSCVATLITDASHKVPVLVNRNGLRTIVVGNPKYDRVDVPYLTSSADIRAGDLLVTSGMGKGFPAGYPVAKVTEVISDRNNAFVEIRATPMAKLNHNKEVLLVWPGRLQADTKATEEISP